MMRKWSGAVALCLVVLRGTAACAACPGDCGGDGDVTVDELVLGVNIALSSASIDQCRAMDTSGEGEVTINELIAAVNSALNGCSAGGFVGDYSGSVAFDSTHAGSISVSAIAGGQLSGSLVITDTLRFRTNLSFTFPAGGASVALSGTYDPSSGGFEISGSFVDANGQTVPVAISGNLPGATGSAQVNVSVGTDVFSATLSAGAEPTPTPTPVPTPPSSDSCADGVLGVTFSNASSDTNADTSALTLGKVTALDQPDPSTGTFIWVITASRCGKAVFGEVARAVVVQGIAVPNRIQPGTYAIGTATPPFININYTETKFTLDPSQNFAHLWTSTGGSLVIDDAGGGALNFHASGVTMAKGLVFKDGTGTFTLDINGTITAVTHN